MRARRSRGAGTRASAVAGLEGLGAGRCARRAVRLLRARVPDLPHLPGQAAHPAARGRPGRAGPLHRGGHREGPAGLPPQRPHGVRLRARPRRLPRPGLHRRLPAPLVGLRAARLRRRRVRQRRATDRRGLPDEPLRRGLGHAAADRAAGRGPPAARRPLLALLLRAHDQARAAPQGDHGPDRAGAAHRLLRLDGVVRVREPARARLLLHQQLAARAPRAERADRERGRLVGAVADRAPGRDRDPVRRLRALGAPARLARPRAGDAVLQDPGRRRADPGAAGVRVVLLRDGRAVPDPDVRRRRLTALPRGDRQLLRLRPRGRLPVQPDAHLARAARALLGRDLVRRRGHLPGADDRPARAQAPGQARLRAARGPGRRRVRNPDRLVPGHPRRAGGRGLQLVRAAGLRVPRPGPHLAGPALDRPVRVGVHALARDAPPARGRAPRQHAVAVLPRGAGDPGVLRRRV